MLLLCYNLLIIVGLIIWFPIMIPRLLKGHYRSVALARLGFNLSLPPNLKGSIWVHALSVGEVRSALPLIVALRQRFAKIPLIFSVATRQGFRTASEMCAAIDGVHLMVRPMDVPWAVKRVIKAIQPSLAILIESDIWPGWQWALGKAKVPRLLVNGRVSPGTFRGYRRFRFMAARMLNAFEQILVQSEVDSRRLQEVGVDSELIRIGGNLKFDSTLDRLKAQERKALLQQLGLGGRTVLVAGSTHPGEEEQILSAFDRLKSKFSRLVLILAPRKIERGQEVARLSNDFGFRTIQLSKGPLGKDDSVLVLDQLGLLAKVYAIGEAAFVGGSWVDVGGHNLLEPAAQGIPQAFGPITYNFLEMALQLEEAGGGVRVEDARQLATVWEQWLADPEEAIEVGRKGLAFCRSHQGAVARAVDCSAMLIKS